MSFFIDISIVEDVNTKLYWNTLTYHPVQQRQMPKKEPLVCTASNVQEIAYFFLSLTFI